MYGWFESKPWDYAALLYKQLGGKGFKVDSIIQAMPL